LNWYPTCQTTGPPSKQPLTSYHEIPNRADSPHAEVPFLLEVGGQTVAGVAPKTTSYNEFATVDLDSIAVPAPGKLQVTVRSKDPSHWHAINLRTITLAPQ
jgi:hypothetical protein